MYIVNPDGYDGYSNLKTGKLLAIIGIVLNVVTIVLFGVMFAMIGSVIFSGDQQAIQEALKDAMGQ